MGAAGWYVDYPLSALWRKGGFDLALFRGTAELGELVEASLSVVADGGDGRARAGTARAGVTNDSGCCAWC